MTAPNTIVSTDYVIEQALELCQKAGKGAGCCLHVVLEEGNVHDDFVTLCVKEAKHRSHKDCERLGRLLYSCSASQRRKVAKTLRACNSRGITREELKAEKREKKKAAKLHFFGGKLRRWTVDKVEKWLRVTWVAGNAVDDFRIIAASDEDDAYDGYAWILLRHKDTGDLYEVYGSHCSCDMYEGQFKPEKTSVPFLLSEQFNPSGLDVPAFHAWFTARLDMK